MKRKLIFLLSLGFAMALNSFAQNPVLERSKAALGLNQLKKPVLHYYYNQVSLGREQSDRTYPPFYTTSFDCEAWMNVPTNITYIKNKGLYPGSGPGDVLRAYYTGVSKYYNVKDTTYTPNANFAEYDKMNALTVLLDWAADPQVKQIKNEVYRDYDRLVFERPALDGMERLFIDPKTYFPVKLDYEQLSSLWGQQHIEIVYCVWELTDGCFLPLASFRMEDGETMVYRTVGKNNLVDTAALFNRVNALPLTGKKNFHYEWYDSEQPVLIKVSDQTYITKNRFYTETFTKIGDTLYQMDATLNQQRAMQDEKLISGVLPNIKKHVLIVTDLAWPHIGGVRYWVSKGATIISHPASKVFLEKVVNRKWTIAPDDLEKNPQKMKFVAIDKMISLAGGKLQVFPIDGIASEGALICNLVDDHLLWASDYVQNPREATAYATEVIRAVNREKLHPEKMVAEHVGVTDWAQIVKVNSPL